MVPRVSASPRRSPPSGFERFFQDIDRRHLLASDVAELRAVAAAVGMDILGPPLSDEEVRQIVDEAEVSSSTS
jgi:hypothetical protein